MRRNATATLISLAFLSSFSAALAAEETTTTTTTPATTAAKPAAKTSGGGGGIFSLPAHVASFAVGTLVGIPVSMFRKSKQETINATKDLVGDNDNKFLIGAASVLGVPAGILSGTMQGVGYGMYNAWAGTADEPFSEEAFSLGDSK